MIVSYKWLQSYFKKTLPQPSDLVELLTMKAFEVEDTHTKGDDTIFDIKVLPDRSPYCLSHRYIAQEIGAIIREEMILPEVVVVSVSSSVPSVSITISDNELCRRYMGRVVESIDIVASPAWLTKRLEAVGQRSINNIVDYTNYVMLDTGQPLHAFDADKVEGGIVVRPANAGEEIVILDGTTVKLTPAMLVIADEVGPLAIAGVKGGKRAEISLSTKRIIIEAANFKAANIRRTSQSVGIRNESSKRFENDVTPERAELAMDMVCSFIYADLPKATFGKIVDIHSTPVTERIFEVSVARINTLLGCSIPSDEMMDMLKWCKIGVDKKTADILSLTVPVYRPDLRAIEDIADEIGRLYGYENVPVRIPTPEFDQPQNKNFYYMNLARKYLVDKGFSEIYTYTLKDGGDMILENPLNIERGSLRNDLSSTIVEKFEFNLRKIDMIGESSVKIFEIGKVFKDKKERWSLAVGIAEPKKTKGDSVNEQVRNIREHLIESLGTNIQTTCTIDDTGGIIILDNKSIGEINRIDGVMEFDLGKVIDALPEPALDAIIAFPPLSHTTFKKISAFPFMVRDIAVFVPGEVGNEHEPLSIIESHGSDLLVRTGLFDTFTKRKEGEPVRTSYAFRLVFQATDRTLTDDEANKIMNKITEEMNLKEGWQVR